MYIHTMTQPFLVVLSRVVARWVSGWLTPLAMKLIPGAKGRRILGWTSLGVSLLVQIVCLVLLQQLVDLCIDLAELWTVLAQKHLEITLDRTS